MTGSEVRPLPGTMGRGGGRLRRFGWTFGTPGVIPPCHRDDVGPNTRPEIDVEAAAVRSTGWLLQRRSRSGNTSGFRSSGTSTATVPRPRSLTKASGTRRVVLARYARNRRLADACYLWAFAA